MTKNYTVGGLYHAYDEEEGGNAPSGSTLVRWGCGIVGALVLLSAIGGIVGFANDWWQAGVTVISPANVRAQFQAAYDDINSLSAVAQNICTLQVARDAELKGTDAYTQRESQVLAQEQNYQRIQNHYNAYVSDPFRAKLVRPSDLPAQAPTEAQEIAIVCQH